jgi:3-dehydroquinate dehydratase type I
VKPRICVPLPIERLSDLAPMIGRAEDAGADLIEIRLDYLQGDILSQIDDVKKAISQASVPLIATNRVHSQGGKRAQKEDRRTQTLVKAAEVGFQYVDVELATANVGTIAKKIRDSGSKPIISLHDFKGTPPDSEMEDAVNSEIKAGAAVCKLVTTAKTLNDSVRCLLFTQKTSRITDVICFAMGSQGILSRILSPLFGGFFTFSSLDTGLETSTGQIPIAELKELYGKLGVGV